MNITKIYLVENCYGDPNKVYIGKTKNSRQYPHIKTFGKYVTYIYIDEINSLDRKDWKPLECYWIEQFRAWGFEVMNKNKGGSGPEFRTDKDNKIIGDKNRHSKPKGFGKKISIALKGRKLIRNWKPNKEHIMKIIESNSKPKSKLTKKKISKTLNKGGNLIIGQKKKEWYNNNIHPGTKQVLQINPTNNKIFKIWNSRKEAIDNGFKGLSYALNKEGHIYKNSIWKYKN